MPPGRGGSNLSEAEMDVLKALWSVGPATVRQLNEELGRRGRSWAYTTVQTLLQRLVVKGCTAADAAGSAHVYRATVDREGLLKGRLRDLADELCGGMPTPLVLALVEGHRYSPEEIARFRALLDVADESGPTEAS